MNKIFKIIWNASLQMFVVTSELAKSSGQSSTVRGAVELSSQSSEGFKKAPVLLAMFAGITLLSMPISFTEEMNLQLDSTESIEADKDSDLNSHAALNYNNIIFSTLSASDEQLSISPFAVANSQNGPIILTGTSTSTTKYDQYTINYNINNPNNVETVLTVEASKGKGNDVIISNNVEINGDVILERGDDSKILRLSVGSDAVINGTVFFGNKDYSQSGQTSTSQYNNFSIGPRANIKKIDMYFNNADGHYYADSYMIHNSAIIDEIYIRKPSTGINTNAISGFQIQNGTSSNVKKIYGEQPYFLLMGNGPTQDYTINEDQTYGGTDDALKNTEFRINARSLTLASSQNLMGGTIYNNAGTTAAAGSGLYTGRINFSATYQGDFNAVVHGSDKTDGTGVRITAINGANVVWTSTEKSTYYNLNIEKGASMVISSPNQLPKVVTNVDGRLVLMTEGFAKFSNFSFIQGAGEWVIQGYDVDGYRPDESNDFVFSSTSTARNFHGDFVVSNLFYVINPDAIDNNQSMVKNFNFIVSDKSWIQFQKGKNNTEATLNNVTMDGGTLDFTQQVTTGAKPLKVTGDFLVRSDSQFAINTIDEITSDALNDLSNMKAYQLMIFDKTQTTFTQDDLDKITYLDADGNTIDSLGYSSDITNSAEVVGTMTYDYRAISKTDTDISTTYKITSIVANDGKVVKLGSTEQYTLEAMITGKGGIEINALKELILAGESTFTGGLNITSGAITASATNSLGLGSINIGTGSSVDLNGQTQTLTTITGEGSFALGKGSLTLTEGGDITTDITGQGSLIIAGDTTLAGAFNTLTADITINNGATLTAGQADTLSGAQSIDVNGRLVLNKDSLAIKTTLTGNGSIVISSKNFSLAGSTLANFKGTFEIQNGTSIVLGGTEILGGSQFKIDQNGQLALKTTTAQSFGQNVTGSGDFNVDLAGQALTLTNSSLSGFTGNLNLTNTKFALNDTNNSLGQSTLVLGSNADVTVTGQQVVGNLTLNSGSLTFDENSILTVTILDLENGGTIDVHANSSGNIDKSGSLITQSNNQTTTTVITATDIKGTLDDVELLVNGSAPSDGISEQYKDANNDYVADLYYGYGLSTNNGIKDGLFLTYGLSRINVLNGKNLVLATDNDQSFSTEITGAGSVTFDLSKGNLSVGRDNSYAGDTTITGGNILTANADNIFGTSGALTIEIGSTVDFNKTSQQVDFVSGAGELALNDGQLILNKDGDLTANIVGAGAITFGNGTTNIKNDNTKLSANLVINSGSIVIVDESKGYGLGSGKINLAGTLSIIDNKNYEFDQTVSGLGAIDLNLGDKNNALTVTSDLSKFKGQLNLSNGSYDVKDNSLSTTKLALNSNAQLTVSNSGSIDTLSFGGGSVNLVDIDATLNVDTLDLSGNGTINITFAGDADHQVASLVDESNHGVDWDAIVADKTVVNKGGVTININGNKYNPTNTSNLKYTTDFEQNGKAVAELNYDYTVDTSKGVTIHSGLTSVNILDQQTLSLGVTSSTSNSNTFNTLLTGSGNLSLDIGAGKALTLGKSNTYTGDTVVTTGTVVAGANEIFGTGNVTVDDSATVDLNGTKQTVKTLSGLGILNINNGTLVINTDSTIGTSFVGKGSIIFANGQSTITSTNVQLDSDVFINNQSVIAVNADNALGNGKINVVKTAKLILNNQIGNAIAGAGTLIINNSNFILGYNQLEKFSGKVNIADSGKATINENAKFGSSVSFDINKTGTLNLLAAKQKNYNFNQSLTGEGLFDVDLKGGAFSFGSNVGTGFTGNLNLTNTTFDLGNADNLKWYTIRYINAR